jgi:hypothetical protein
MPAQLRCVPQHLMPEAVYTCYFDDMAIILSTQPHAAHRRFEMPLLQLLMLSLPAGSSNHTIKHVINVRHRATQHR